ncbi:hypothetical protein C0995_013913 [Termitomyces sp. Mi166|nr:hypothetical protein C0995_013913 [Termitomyces sp. Mi166\
MKDTYKSIWLMLKILLFSIIVSDSTLAAAIYVRPQALSPNESQVIPHMLAKSVLQTLVHLSFIVSQFGRVTATATGDDLGFVELRKAFYLALNVLSAEEPSREQRSQGQDFNHCESFVKETVMDLGVDTYQSMLVLGHAPSINSQDGRLTMVQLRLAYSALMRSASTSDSESKIAYQGGVHHYGITSDDETQDDLDAFETVNEFSEDIAVMSKTKTLYQQIEELKRKKQWNKAEAVQSLRYTGHSERTLQYQAQKAWEQQALQEQAKKNHE